MKDRPTTGLDQCTDWSSPWCTDWVKDRPTTGLDTDWVNDRVNDRPTTGLDQAHGDKSMRCGQESVHDMDKGIRTSACGQEYPHECMQAVHAHKSMRTRTCRRVACRLATSASPHKRVSAGAERVPCGAERVPRASGAERVPLVTYQLQKVPLVTCVILCGCRWSHFCELV